MNKNIIKIVLKVITLLCMIFYLGSIDKNEYLAFNFGIIYFALLFTFYMLFKFKKNKIVINVIYDLSFIALLGYTLMILWSVYNSFTNDPYDRYFYVFEVFSLVSFDIVVVNLLDDIFSFKNINKYNFWCNVISYITIILLFIRFLTLNSKLLSFSERSYYMYQNYLYIFIFVVITFISGLINKKTA